MPGHTELGGCSSIIRLLPSLVYLGIKPQVVVEGASTQANPSTFTPEDHSTRLPQSSLPPVLSMGHSIVVTMNRSSRLLYEVRLPL